MFNSNNRLIKAVGYLLVGFFLFIIVLSFGMPDLGLNCGPARGTVAIVNGEKVHALDLYRFRDLKFSKIKDPKMMPYILDNYIMEILLRQQAEDLGLITTDEKMLRYIKETPYFKNPKTQKYDPEILKMVLRNYRMSFEEFEKISKRDLMINELRYLISKGIATSSNDIKAKYKADNSKLKIKFAYISDKDLEKRFKKDLVVSQNEIDGRIKESREEIKDPKKDKIRIEKKIKSEKLDRVKKSIEEKINTMAKEGASFAQAVKVLKGTNGSSKIFKIGETIRNSDKKGISLTPLSNSKVLRENLMKLPKGKVSPAFNSRRGIFIFTTELKEIPREMPKEEELEKIEKSQMYGLINSLQRNLYRSLNENSKILKNLQMK